MKTWNAFFGLLVVTVLMSSSALALEIRVAPKTLVLSSSGGKLTVHTNVPYRLVDRTKTEFRINDQPVTPFRQFYDDRLNLVVQCTKEAVKPLVGVSRKRTTAEVSLKITLTYGDTQEDDEIFYVKP